jgi:DNA (cytosine-5)-methyltransferase 1
MNHLDLFSGIGGFSYAAQQIWKDDHNIIAFVEKDKYCQRVLKKHWPNIPIIDDVRGFNYEKFTDVSNTESTDGKTSKNTEGWSQMQSGRGSCRSRTAKIDLLTGGFPCQPFSVAGRRKGKSDDRYLWPNMFKIIQETKPTWIIGENVPGIINMGLEAAVLDLEEEGYQVEVLVLPAIGISALHKRNRVWIIANTNNSGSGTSEYGSKREGQKDEQEHEGQSFDRSGRQGEDVSDTDTERSQRYRNTENKDKERRQEQTGHIRKSCGSTNRTFKNSRENTFTQQRLGNMVDGLSGELGKLGMIWNKEPNIPRVTTGTKDRISKLTALGNAIVPQVVMPIMWAIKEIEYNKSINRQDDRQSAKGSKEIFQVEKSTQ